MHFLRKSWILLSILGIVLTGCGSAVATSTPVDPDAISTSLVGTMVANIFETQTALAPVPTETASATPAPLPSLTFPTAIAPTSTIYYYFPTGTPVLTFTPTVTGTIFTPTVNPDTLAFGCNNLAFVRDVTIPSGTVMAPGQDFSKTWKVANIGTCDWKYVYTLVLAGGPAMNGKTQKLNRIVTAGHWAELSIGLGAPKAPGKYTSYWRMADGDGHMFGASLMVSIVVSGTPTKTPTQTPSQTPTNTSSAPAATSTATNTSPAATSTDTPEPTATSTLTGTP